MNRRKIEEITLHALRQIMDEMESPVDVKPKRKRNEWKPKGEIPTEVRNAVRRRLSNG